VSGAVKTAGVYNLKPGARIEDAIQAAGGFTANAQRDAINLADYARDADQYNIPTVAPKAAPVAPASVHRPTIVHGSMAAVPHPVAAEPSVSKSAKHTETTASVSPSVETVAVTVPGRVLGKAPEIAVSTETAAEVATGQDIETGGVSDTKQKHSTHKGASGKSGGSSSKFKNPGDGIVHLNTATAEELQKLPGVGPSMASRILEYRQQVGKFADISQIQDVKGIGPKKYSKMAAFLDL
jgi:competence ComEA-like helix-hairpin-helix protein